MKTRSILFAIFVGAAISASAQTTFNPAHTYKEGATDAYAVKVNATTSMGAITMTMDTTQTVKKVYENGDADIESAIANMSVSMNGQEFPVPNGGKSSTTTKMNKFGLPLSTSGQSRGVNFGQFGSFVGDKELKVGETFTFDNPNPQNPKNHTKGTIKLLSINDGKAKFTMSIDVITEGAEKPMHLDGNMTADAANGKMLHFDGKVKDLPAQGGQGPAVSAADFTMDHK
jgi:hypothetical protein